MFAKLLIDLPEGQVFQKEHQARAVFAKAAEGSESRLPVEELLWYSGGHPRTTPSPYRFGSFRKGRSFELVALGYQPVVTLIGAAKDITSLISRHYGVDALRDQRIAGDCDFRVIDGFTRFRASQLVFQRKNFALVREALRDKQFNHPELLTMIETAILRGFAKQCALTGLDYPERDVFLSEIELHKAHPVEVKEGRFSLKGDVTFMANVELRGPWAVGLLCGRGFGKLHPRR